MKTPAPFQSSRFLWIIIILGIVTLATLKQRYNRVKPPESSSSAVTTNAPAAAATDQAKPDFQKLTGRWVRPDGGYVIEIKSAESNGKLDAGYFNPKPIHVAKAEATQEGSATKVFIE